MEVRGSSTVEVLRCVREVQAAPLALRSVREVQAAPLALHSVWEVQVLRSVREVP